MKRNVDEVEGGSPEPDDPLFKKHTRPAFLRKQAVTKTRSAATKAM